MEKRSRRSENRRYGLGMAKNTRSLKPQKVYREMVFSRLRQSGKKHATTTSAGSVPAWEWNQEPDHLPSTWKHVGNDLEVVEMDSGWKEDFHISDASELYRERVFRVFRWLGPFPTHLG